MQVPRPPSSGRAHRRSGGVLAVVVGLTALAAACTVEHGEVAVREVATIFKKIKLDTNENVGWGRISIPEESRHTTGYWFSLDDTVAWYENDGAQVFTERPVSTTVDGASDVEAADVAGARGAGMRAVHYVARGGSPAPEADGAARYLAELPDVIARLG